MDDFIYQAGHSLYELFVDSIENFVHSKEYEKLQKKYTFDTDKLRFELFSVSAVALIEIAKDVFSNSASEFFSKLWDKILHDLKTEGNLDDKSISVLGSYVENRVSFLRPLAESMSEAEFCKAVGETVEKNVAGRPHSRGDLSKGVSAFFVVIETEAAKLLKELKPGKSSFMTPAEENIYRFGKRLFQGAIVAADTVAEAYEKKGEGGKKIDDLQYRLIVLEFLYFFLNWVDRHAFGEFGIERRNTFIDLLVEKTNEFVVAEGSKIAPKFNMEEKIKGNITFRGMNIDIYNSCVVEYGKFKKILGEDWTPYISTFGDNVARILDDDPEIWLLSRTVAMEFLTSLNILDYLREVKKQFG